ncbi:hypothetical protein B9Z55_008783 [Caenorhabditis nigoni]|uniref:SCP domain-containing protein n=1 Tax=Caenorhabditis nigoni TaxID=1611254 RepID=A0A2G5UQ01_9PELO|nr:hypothetical protein B9Z55_008783 [Caenorhabditis nigoni]
MKAVNIIAFLLLLAVSVSTGVRVKRGLSTDEQKKLVDTLNADRQALGKNMGITFEKLTYDKGLELKAENYICHNHGKPLVPLKVNKVMKEENDLAVQDTGVDLWSRAFFNPKHTKIGCSKEKTCSYTLTHEKWSGKTCTYWGVCDFAPEVDYRFDASNTPEKARMPSYEKYEDLLEVGGEPQDSPTGSSGRFFSLTLLLGTIIISF